MKMSVLFLACVFAITGITANAQGGFQMPTPEERTMQAMFKLDSAFKFEEVKKKEVYDILFAFFEARSKIISDMVGSGNGEGMREKIQPLMDQRDEKLKTVLGDENFAIWKKKIEPTLLRRGRGPGGGGRPQ